MLHFIPIYSDAMAVYVPQDDLDKRLHHMPGLYSRPTCLQSTPSQYCQILKCQILCVMKLLGCSYSVFFFVFFFMYSMHIRVPTQAS